MKTAQYFLLGFALLVFSCVEGPEIDPDQTPAFTETIALTAFMNSIDLETFKIQEKALKISYPIRLNYNSNISIEVANDQGFKEVTESQSSGLNITGIELPIEFTVDNETFKISSVIEFSDALNTLDIEAFRKVFDRSIGQCFEMVYPVSLVDTKGEVVVIESDDELEVFLETEGATYQPQFVFPFSVRVASQNDELSIKAAFDLYQLFNDCVTCPDLFFEADQIGQFEYKFVADFPGIEDLPSYDWVVDGQVVESDGVLHSGDNQLVQNLDFGLHEVCIKTETIDCAEGVSFCLTILNDPCPDLFFKTTNNNGEYTFVADFFEMEEVTYEWSVSFDGQTIGTETESPGGDNEFKFDFEPGVYRVCIATETPDCPSGIEYCVELTVN